MKKLIKLLFIANIVVICLLVSYMIKSTCMYGTTNCKNYTGVYNFLEELKVANKTKDLKKLKELSRQARGCLKDKLMQEKINNYIKDIKQAGK